MFTFQKRLRVGLVQFVAFYVAINCFEHVFVAELGNVGHELPGARVTCVLTQIVGQIHFGTLILTYTKVETCYLEAFPVFLYLSQLGEITGSY